MTITIASETLGKKSTLTREKLRKIMVENWGWDQGKADSHLVFLEFSPDVLTIETPKGPITLQAI